MRVLRYEVPVDDFTHVISLSGEVYPFINASHPHIVEFWSLDTGGPSTDRKFRVVGTGQPLPISEYWEGDYVGTAIHIITPSGLPGSRLVWHLFEIK